MRKTERWILAFDASCGVCRKVSGAVAEASGARLEVLPLDDEQVRRWREASLGKEPKWVPTVIRVSEDDVNAWTGRAMVLPLVRRLGLRPTIRVVNALGALKQAESERAQDQEDGSKAMGRKSFLRFGAGASVAAALVLAGQRQAFAQDEAKAARLWVEENAGRLPESYAAFAAYPLEHRRAIFDALPSPVRSRLSVEHVRTYRKTAQLTPEQDEVVNSALALFGRTDLFDGHASESLRQQSADLKTAAVAAFGQEEAAALLATLGPVQPRRKQARSSFDCECNTREAWCGGAWCIYTQPNCTGSSTGCGLGWILKCDGMCA